ncbi:MAG: pseudaminic acid CMP-transferase PseF [Oceanicaulis sp. HLUCCA04]|nr:MAG: pseudaminic acid CMP-transferase PseF [Oceanicaulis sp. HLUCCA04]
MRRARVIAVIQARTGSSRLPGKVLSPLYGDVSILEHQCRQLSRIDGVDQLVVATTDLAADDAITRLTARLGIKTVRGSSEDVLSRFVKTANETVATTLVRITSDSPLRDPHIIARCVAHHQTHGLEYTRPGDGSLPRGLRAEVIEASVLRQLDADPALDPAYREHVTLAIRQHPERYRCGSPDFPAEWARPEYDFSVDTQADLDFMRTVWAQLERRGWPADTAHLCALLDDMKAPQSRAGDVA